MAWTGMNYSAPNEHLSSIDTQGGQFPSSEQLQTFKWLKKALVTARKDQYFLPLASVEDMPKHFGKTIKVYEYIPLLDDRNINDQGIDAAGVTIVESHKVTLPAVTKTLADAGRRTAFKLQFADLFAKYSITLGTAAGNIDLAIADNGGSDVKLTTTAAVDLNNDAVVDFLGNGQLAAEFVALWGEGAYATSVSSGNLYGSSKDIGTITGKIPHLREEGGRVNRVGYSRILREGSISKFGFFHEFTKETLDFDSDDELNDHLSTELMNGATQITEAQLQMDLIAGAGVQYFTGTSTSLDTMQAYSSNSGSADAIVTYEDLSRLDQILTDNRTPTQTKIITGSRNIDTRTIRGGRIAYVGSEVVPLLKRMKDPFGNAAFIGVQQYADATTLLNGEIGAIDGFRFIQVPEMLHHADAGAAHSNTTYGYRADGAHWNAYPILVVGSDSFSTIGFQTNGKSVNFNIITKMPGRETAGYHDPYGETGFSSVKWWYGHLIKRPERLAVLWTLAPI